MPLAIKFLLSTCPERHLLSLRSSSTLNISVIQALSPSSIAYCLSSPTVSPLLLVPLLISCVFPSAVCYTSISTLLYASYRISSSVFRGQGSFVSPVHRSVLSLYLCPLPWKYPISPARMRRGSCVHCWYSH